jgi:hypothetical protein
VGDQGVLDLPADLDVEPAVGMGGWPADTEDQPCAVNLTGPANPGRHITFAEGTLPYGFGEELGGVGLEARGMRWGTIEDGYGAELTSAIDGEATIYVVAYGITEDEAAALFASLASS